MNQNTFSRRQILAGAAALACINALKAIPASDVKLSVTSDEIDEDPEVAAKFLERFDVHYLELRSILGKYNTQQPVETITSARKIFDSHQVHTAIIDTAFFRAGIPANGAALDKEWTVLNAAMDRGDILGTKLLRIFAFMPADKSMVSTPVPPHVYELLEEAGKRAQARQFRLAIENLKGGYVQTGADSARLLKNIKADNVGLNWDPNNAAASGEQSFPDGYRKLDAARIFNVHLRDYRHNQNGEVEWVAVGTGEFNNVAQIRALLKDGYRGALNLETHWRPPQGKAYATETSLKALLKVIAEV
jgi:L-ribulose-5-phosphate 3-epimerase